MFRNTIDNKPIIRDKNGYSLLDLTVSIFNKQSSATAMQAYRIPEAYAMRPDLISMAVYNTTEYAEIILKYNGISNPFSLNPGDIIMIPDIDDALSAINTNLISDKDNTIDGAKFIDTDKNPTISQENIDFDRRNVINNNTDNIVLPNIADENESQVTIRGGKIFFGDVNKIPCNSTQGMTVGDYLTNIIKNT